MAEKRAKLKRRAEKALIALLTTSSVSEAARQADVPERSLYRWLREDEEFKSAYQEARWALVTQAIAFLQQASGQAVQALVDAITDVQTPASIKVSAAKAVLELSLRSVEIQVLAQRIDALERGARLPGGTSNGHHAYGMPQAPYGP